MAIIFPEKLKTSKNKQKHDNDLDLSPLKLKMNRALLSTVDKYTKFDDPNCNGLSCIKATSITLTAILWP